MCTKVEPYISAEEVVKGGQFSAGLFRLGLVFLDYGGVGRWVCVWQACVLSHWVALCGKDSRRWQ